MCSVERARHDAEKAAAQHRAAAASISSARRLPAAPRTEAEELDEAAALLESAPSSPPPSISIALRLSDGAIFPTRAKVRVRWEVAASADACSDSDYIALLPDGCIDAGAVLPVRAPVGQHFNVEFSDGAAAGEVAISLPSFPCVCVCAYVHGTGHVLALSERIFCGVPAPPAAAPCVLTPPLPSAHEHRGLRYCLEKLVRVCVYTVYVPLPLPYRAVAASKAGESAPDPDADAVAQRWQPLPRGWQPGVRVEPVDAPGPSTLDLSMDLPTHAPADRLTVAALRALPRTTYSLRLPLMHRIEAVKASWTVLPDHVLVRLPMYYPGSAIPDRPPTLVRPQEIANLRAHARGENVRCRLCGAHVVQPRPDGSPYAAHILPSDHWLDWTDLWMCHGDEKNVYLPDADFGAKRGALLIGETHVQAHPHDVCNIALQPVADTFGPEDEWAHLRARCLRCSSVLGECLWHPSWGSGLPDFLRAACARTDSMDRLGLQVHPTITLWKHALVLQVPRESASTQAWSAFAPFSHVAHTIYAAVTAHQQYQFRLASDETPVVVYMHVLNWNLSFRGTSSPGVPGTWSSSEHAAARVRFKAGTRGDADGHELQVGAEAMESTLLVLLETAAMLPPFPDFGPVTRSRTDVTTHTHTHAASRVHHLAELVREPRFGFLPFLVPELPSAAP